MFERIRKRVADIGHRQPQHLFPEHSDKMAAARGRAYQGAGIALMFWILAIAAGLLFRHPLRELENMLYDIRMRLPHNVEAYEDIVFVDIDDTSIELLGRWPWPRSRVAEVIRVLNHAGISGIFVDILFAEETDADEDIALARAMEDSNPVFLGVGVQFLEQDGTQPQVISQPASGNPFLQSLTYRAAATGNTKIAKAGRTLAPITTFMATAAGIGHISFTPDEDGVARHMPLFVELGGKYFPSIDIELARNILDVTREHVEISPGRHVILKHARRPDEREPADIVIPVDSRMRMLINYAGRWSKSFKHYALHSLLAALLGEDETVREHAKSLLSGKLLVLSIAFSGASDMGPTPMEPLVPLSEIHGHVVSSIVQQQFLIPVSAFATMAAAFFVSLGLGILGFKMKTLWYSGITAGIVILWVIIAFGLFAARALVIDIAWPCLAIISAYGGCAGFVHLKTERERASLRQAFSRYVSPALLSQIVEHPDHIRLGGQRVNLTILVLVLETFERTAENAEPEEIIDLLSSVYEKACEPILECNGAIDTFTKDGLIAFFGAPITQKDHALSAVNAALSIRRSLLELGVERNRSGKRTIGTKMAINTGFATVGNIGSSRRMNYTVIGKSVNLCVHLARAAREGQILVIRKTYQALEAIVTAEDRGEIRIEPYPKPYFVYNIIGLPDEKPAAQHFPVQASLDLEKKKFLGPYTLLEKIGAGNTGTVYRGYDESLDRQVAIKVLFPHLYKDRIAAVAKEARTLAKLSHPNVVQVYYAGEEDDIGFLVMEFVDGVTVRELLNSEGSLPPPDALDILIQTARGLNAAHKEGIIHRDIKPANLLVNNHNIVKITDFGLARLLAQDESTHTVAGTFQYISPEQSTGAKIDCRSDIYSLGITLFHLLAGEPPFKADTLAGLVWHHTNSSLPLEPLFENNIPEAVIALLQKMTNKTPEDRYENYLELLKELDRVEAAV